MTKRTGRPEAERQVDITTPQVMAEFARGRELYDAFTQRFFDLKLSDHASIEQAHAWAQEHGIFEQAAHLRTLVFGKKMSTYGVVYFRDDCIGKCLMCPDRMDSIDAATGEPTKRNVLSLPEILDETHTVQADGHRSICYLAGDGEMTAYQQIKFFPILKALNSVDGLDEIILNVTPQKEEMFRIWREAVPDKALQFRVFQETYDRDVYAAKMISGPKKDYDFRRGAQARAMRAGFDDYGLGVLLGLNDYFVQELAMLVAHKEELTAELGRPPARVCLPSANTLAGIENVEPQIKVIAQANELAYALARLAMPEVSIVSSERDTPEMLRILDRYATNRTVNVQPSVGGNAKGRVTPLAQTTVFPWEPHFAIADYAARGYELLLYPKRE